MIWTIGVGNEKHRDDLESGVKEELGEFRGQEAVVILFQLVSRIPLGPGRAGKSSRKSLFSVQDWNI